MGTEPLPFPKDMLVLGLATIGAKPFFICIFCTIYVILMIKHAEKSGIMQYSACDGNFNSKFHVRRREERNGILPATLYPDLDIRFKVKIEPPLGCM